MSLDVEKVKALLELSFAEVESATASVLRCVRRAGPRPFAICYVDLATELPTTEDALRGYQDELIGRHFFEGRKSLQWNTYLYFVRSADFLEEKRAKRARALIEKDRTYARKYVIEEGDLERLVPPPDLTANPSARRRDIFLAWNERLESAGLDEIVLGDMDLAKKLRAIQAGTRSSPRRSPQKVKGPQGPPAFVRSLGLEKYRPYPLQRKFEFGSVNLIHGPNGAGKTSLLEAIEWFYCGKNHRSHDRIQKYVLEVELEGGEGVLATSSRPLQEFRDKNLAWYGQAEVKSNNLHASFARFNFLDTDAAVGLAAAGPSLEEDLSRLLIGPSAAEAWRRIERVHEGLLAATRELERLEGGAASDLEEAQRLSDSTAHEASRSKGLRLEIGSMAKRLRWRNADAGDRATSVRLSGRLGQLVSVLQQVRKLRGLDTVASIEDLGAIHRRESKRVQRIEEVMNRLGLAEGAFLESDQRAREASQEFSLLKEWARYGRAEFAETLELVEELSTSISDNAELLADLKVDEVVARFAGSADEPVRALSRRAARLRDAAESKVLLLEGTLEAHRKAEEEVAFLRAEIRQLGERLLRKADLDGCPLCGTAYSKDVLRTRIEQRRPGVGEHSVGKELLGLREAREELATRLRGEALCEELRRFCVRANLGTATTVGAVIEVASTHAAQLAEAKRNLTAAKKKLNKCAQDGLSRDRLREIGARLRKTRPKLGSYSAGTASLMIAEAEKAQVRAEAELERRRALAESIRKVMASEMGQSSYAASEVDRELSMLRSGVAEIDALTSRLAPLLGEFPWPAKRPIAELEVEAKTMRKLLGDLQSTLDRERQAAQEGSALKKRIVEREQELRDLRPKLARLKEAKKVITSLRTHHSISGEMKSALRENRVRIEEIFGRIHVPAEFSRLGETLTTLIRSADQEECTLSEVSTGLPPTLWTLR